MMDILRFGLKICGSIVQTPLYLLSVELLLQKKMFEAKKALLNFPVYHQPGNYYQIFILKRNLADRSRDIQSTGSTHWWTWVGALGACPCQL